MVWDGIEWPHLGVREAGKANSFHWARCCPQPNLGSLARRHPGIGPGWAPAASALAADGTRGVLEKGVHEDSLL